MPDLYNRAMALTCNIDRKGRIARLIYGLVMLLLALVLLWFWAWRGGSAVSWIVTICAILAALVSVFEARVGWCAMRAMGFRTRM